MRVSLRIRFGYGSIVPWTVKTPDGITATAGPDSLWLRTPVRLAGRNLAHTATFSVSAGDSVPFVLTYVASHQGEPAQLDALQSLEQTRKFWASWVSRCTYDGTYRDAVVRSLITLKALTYQPTGGIVAAATPSLPEDIGGVRNWDYRYCWLRDATITLEALLRTGYTDEAKAWRLWLGRAIAGNPKDIQIMYGVAGERRLAEWEAGWLPGYEGSAPVRIGNAAAGQLQLDVYGEVIDALQLSCKSGLHDDQHTWSLQRSLLGFLEEHWREPDEGLWEVRGPRRHFVHSKVMAWVGFDRAASYAEEAGHPRHDQARGVREGLQLRARRLHPVLRRDRTRRLRLAHLRRRLPGCRRPQDRVYDEGTATRPDARRLPAPLRAAARRHVGGGRAGRFGRGLSRLQFLDGERAGAERPA